MTTATQDRTIAELERELARLRAKQVAPEADEDVVRTKADWQRLLTRKNRGENYSEHDLSLSWQRYDRTFRAAREARAELDAQIASLEGQIDDARTPQRPLDPELVALEAQLADVERRREAEYAEPERLELQAQIHDHQRRVSTREERLLSAEAEAELGLKLARAKRIHNARIRDLADEERRVVAAIELRLQLLFDQAAAPHYARIADRLRDVLAETERLHYVHRSFRGPRGIHAVNPLGGFTAARISALLERFPD
jgi:chromosome segregation ATPase